MTSKGLVWASASLILITILLGFVVRLDAIKPLEHTVFLWFALHDTKADWLWIAIARWLSWAGMASPRSLMMIAAALWLVWRKRPRAALVMLVVPVLSAVASTVLKESFGRVRPHLVPQLEIINNPAFPSGHATNAASLFLLLALLIPGPHPRLTMAGCAGAALMIGLSRIMLGVHWPSDVLGGWMLGSAFALAGLAIANKWERAA